MMAVKMLFVAQCDNDSCGRVSRAIEAKTKAQLKEELRSHCWRFLYDQEMNQEFIFCDECVHNMGIGYEQEED
jgi:hypothetical protein